MAKACKLSGAEIGGLSKPAGEAIECTVDEVGDSHPDAPTDTCNNLEIPEREIPTVAEKQIVWRTIKFVQKFGYC